MVVLTEKTLRKVLTSFGDLEEIGIVDIVSKVLEFQRKTESSLRSEQPLYLSIAIIDLAFEVNGRQNRAFLRDHLAVEFGFTQFKLNEYSKVLRLCRSYLKIGDSELEQSRFRAFENLTLRFPLLEKFLDQSEGVAVVKFEVEKIKTIYNSSCPEKSSAPTQTISSCDTEILGIAAYFVLADLLQV